MFDSIQISFLQGKQQQQQAAGLRSSCTSYLEKGKKRLIAHQNEPGNVNLNADILQHFIALNIAHISSYSDAQ